MYIIEVIPIARGMGADTLSYFSATSLPVGSLISVPLRKKKVAGIVAASRPASESKADIKQANFALKKITVKAGSKKSNRQIFSVEFMETARSAAEYYATSVGSILAALVPDIILKKAAVLEPASGSAGGAPLAGASAGQKNIHETHVMQGDDDERYVSYRALIRQEFARKSSVFVCLPTIEDATRAYELLEKGIGKYAFLLHGALPQKKIIETWNAVMKEKHPVAIIATGAFLSIPRNDLGAIILEKESSRGWKSLRRPFIDIRRIAEMYAEKKSIPLTMGDTLLTTETLWRESEGEIVAASPFKFRSISLAKDTLVDMKQYKSGSGQFRILSDEVERLILSNKEASERMIIYAQRRGAAPSVICADCQTIVTCNQCSSPVVLHDMPNQKSFFMCHRCGERRSSEEYCKVCQSWKLATMGIGIDLVAQKIRDKFPGVMLTQIDADSVKTVTQARAAIAHFKAYPGSILLGTEMMLSYLTGKVDNAVVVSLDSLLSIPDFRINEKIVHTLLKIRSLTERHMIVQTRKADEKIFNYALKGNLSDFHRTEIDERKKWKYPPFITLIKITIEGKKDEISAEMAAIQKNFEPHVVDIFPAFTHTVRGNYVLHGLIRIARDKWPDVDLAAKLRTLPPYVTVNIDPDSLL
jgi:primosomal protein N' (replication factor Y)